MTFKELTLDEEEKEEMKLFREPTIVNRKAPSNIKLDDSDDLRVKDLDDSDVVESDEEGKVHIPQQDQAIKEFKIETEAQCAKLMRLFKPMMVNRKNKIVALNKLKLQEKVLKENEDMDTQMHPQISNRSKLLAEKNRKRSQLRLAEQISPVPEVEEEKVEEEGQEEENREESTMMKKVMNTIHSRLYANSFQIKEKKLELQK